MGGDVEHWKRCLVSSIQLFCRNFCQYDSEAKIDGILAITLDKKEVILVKLHETYGSETSNARMTNPPSKEQSEQLQSILQYLAPSCRLLKKAIVKPTASLPLPQVWKPVTSELTSQETFVRSLGLLPITQVAVRKSAGTSSVEQLKTSCVDTADHTNSKSTALKNMDLKVEIENFQKGDMSFVRSQSSSPKLKKASIKSNVNVSEKLKEFKKGGQSNKTKLKIPLATSLAMNCHSDVRVCLGVKSVNLLMQDETGRRLSKISEKAKVGSKKVSSKRQVGCANGQRNVSNCTKKQFRSNLDSLKHKKDSAASSQTLKKKANRKRKLVEASRSQTSNKKQLISQNCGEKSSVDVHKVECRRKKSVRSTLLADSMKKKLANKALLKKTKVCRLKRHFGTTSVSKQIFSKARTGCCGKCSGCKTLENCQVCASCKDMKVYGGPNKLHQKCRLRQCRALTKGRNTKKCSKSCRTVTSNDDAETSSSV